MSDEYELIPTRLTLLSRLKDWNDQKSWQEFFDTYWRCIYRAAVKMGLTHEEAQDVVQDTVISVVKNITQFTYDPQKGSFKGWLLTLTRWRIMDQFRMRQKEINNETPQAGTEPRTDIVERIADPSTDALEEIWDQEWRQNIFELALQNVMQRVDPKNYQIFDLHVVRKWSMAKVANALKVNRASVYLAKHRISKLLRSEIKTLETQILDNERHKAK